MYFMGVKSSIAITNYGAISKLDKRIIFLHTILRLEADTTQRLG